MHYYSDDGTKFTSKVKAIEYRIKTKQKIYFYHYDDIYSKYDWTTEPTESLDYYYKDQAQRLRDKYDYLILCYSGGYDSSNILETFHFNNIKLDKIVTVGALSQDANSGVDDNHNGELYHNVFPYLKELGLESISEVIDYTNYFDNIKTNLSITQYDDEWIDSFCGWYSPHNWFWRDFEKFVVPKNIGNKSVGIIFGRDKPGLYYGKGKHDNIILPSGNSMLNGFYFKDNPYMSYGSVLTQQMPNVDRVNFYWDPTYPEILLKQLHVIKKYYMNTHSTSYDPNVGSQLFGNKMVDLLVYNLKRPILFKSPKSKTGILSLRDQYLMNSKDSDVYSLYKAGIDKMKNRIDLNELNVINSKFYEILK